MATRASNRGVRARGRGRNKSPGPSKMPAHLQQSYLTGKVAARIRWNSPGDWTRCRSQARVHGMGRKAEGACARLHRIATGTWPGSRNNVGRRG